MRLTNRPLSSFGDAPGLLRLRLLDPRLLARELVGGADQQRRIDAGRVADQSENQNRADRQAAGAAGKTAAAAAKTTATAACFTAAILDVLTFRKVFPAHERESLLSSVRAELTYPSAVTNAQLINIVPRQFLPSAYAAFD